MTTHCPFVGVCGDDQAQPPIEHPSFENCCFALELVDANKDPLLRPQLLLADQATYCLSEAYALCPRFRLARPGAPLPDDLLAAAGQAEAETSVPASPRSSRAQMAAAAAGLLLVLVLCGGSLAAYAGWQLASQGLDRMAQRLAAGQTEPGEVLVLVTATPEPPAENVIVLITPTNDFNGSREKTPLPLPTATPTFEFPPAVTATALPGARQGPIVITTPTPETVPQGDDPADPLLLTAVAGPVVITTPGPQLFTPTRRPTPVFVVPTSTPFAGGGVIVVTATADPATGEAFPEPIVNFRAAHQSLLPGDCTIVSWDVQNVRAVFFDGEGVQGSGERRLCVRYTSETATLSILRLDGRQEDHRITVQIVPHTLTPTPAPTDTPVLTPTPSWTPEGTPEATAPPPRVALRLTVDGGNLRRCEAGKLCTATIQVHNDGDLADEIFLDLQKSGDWPAVICRDDGSCGDTAISFGVGAGASRSAVIQVEVPDSAASISYSFVVQATSGNSNRTIHAEPAQVNFSVP